MIFLRRQSLSEAEEGLFQQVANWPEHPTLDSLTESTLREVTAIEGVDFATGLLFDRLRRSPRHSNFIQRIDELRHAPICREFPTDTKVAVVPAALYLERPDLGGDGRLIREIGGRFGLVSTLVPVASLGSIFENAQRIRTWLAQQAGQPLILVSLSKGGSDLKLALAAPDAPELFHNVIAWVNVCGPLNGAAMADWILSSRLRTWLCRLQYRLHRRDFQFVTAMSRSRSAVFNSPLRLCGAMRLINLIGFPLARHLSTRFSRFCHRTLSTHGPNDGTVLLSDAARWPGDIYPVWGTDHFFRPDSMAENLITAVFLYLAETAGKPDRN